MSEFAEFQSFNKIARLNREIIITEKIDGTNAQIAIDLDGTVRAGSRNRWITPEADNYGFARWVENNSDYLIRTLGYGRHFGEWWGQGIQRNYGLKYRMFSLFNTSRWSGIDTDILSTVPVLYSGIFSMEAINNSLRLLRENGSVAAPGFMNPEGIVIYHVAANQLFKVTLKNDELPKTLVK